MSSADNETGGLTLTGMDTMMIDGGVVNQGAQSPLLV